jgi:hypothetical protein
MMPLDREILLLGSFYLFGAVQLEVIIGSTRLSSWGLKQNELCELYSLCIQIAFSCNRRWHVWSIGAAGARMDARVWTQLPCPSCLIRRVPLPFGPWLRP